MPEAAVYISPVFGKALRRLIKKEYPKSSEDIERALRRLGKNPGMGDRVRGFGDKEVVKMRIGLPSYRLSASRGLRLIYNYIPYKRIVIPLHIYSKARYKDEFEVNQQANEALAQILSEL